MKQRGSTRLELERWGFAPDLFRQFTNETSNYIRQLRELYSSLKVSTASYGQSSHSGHISDPTANTVSRIAERSKVYKSLLSDIEKQEAVLKEKVGIMDGIITSLPGLQREVIIYRYKKRYEWRDIAAKFNISTRQAHRIEAAAVDKIDKELEKHSIFTK